MKLIPTLTTKTKDAKPCTDCKVNIEIGEKYISVFYNDGFRKKLYGLYHKSCWNRIEPINQVQ